MNKKTALFALAAAVLASVSAQAQAAAESGDVYTQVNLWVEQPKPIPSTNYHKGELIPVGSKVSVGAAGGDTISFTYKGQGQSITWMRKHTLVSLEQVKARTFGPANPLESKVFTDLPKEQQDAVKAGRVIVGMPKAAVLMAYGYPPEHKTPSREGNLWLYWRDRFKTQSVSFTDDKVSSTVGFGN